MHYVLLTCLFGSVLSAGSFYSRQRMSRIPPPMKGFDTTRAAGKWYISYAVNPDSWRGADGFTDWYQYFTINKNTVSAVDVWRNPDVSGECSRTPYALSTGEAVYFLDHSTGGATSGSAVIVATDYKYYLVLWGCTKPSVHRGRCEDFYILVKTRSPYPSPRTHRAVDEIFRKLWGVTTTDILRIKQGKPCKFSGEPDYKGVVVPRPFLGPAAKGPDSFRGRGAERPQRVPYRNPGPIGGPRREPPFGGPDRGPLMGPPLIPDISKYWRY